MFCVIQQSITQNAWRHFPGRMTLCTSCFGINVCILKLITSKFFRSWHYLLAGLVFRVVRSSCYVIFVLFRTYITWQNPAYLPNVVIHI